MITAGRALHDGYPPTAAGRTRPAVPDRIVGGQRATVTVL